MTDNSHANSSKREILLMQFSMEHRSYFPIQEVFCTQIAAKFKYSLSIIMIVIILSGRKMLHIIRGTDAVLI